MYLGVERVELVQPRVGAHHLGLSFAQHLICAHYYRLRAAVAGLFDLHHRVHPNRAGLIGVHEPMQHYSRPLLVVRGDALVPRLDLHKVVAVDELVPGHAGDLLLRVTQVMFAAALVRFEVGVEEDWG